MKKIIAILLISVLLLSLAGCGAETQKTAGTSQTPPISSNENAQASETTDSSVSQESAASGNTDAQAPVSQENAVSDNSESKKEDLGSNDKTEAVSEPAQSNAASSNSTTGAATKAQISKEEAKNIALWNASVTGSEIRDYEIELDKDGGVLHYEISFKFQNMEFEYEINAADGTIIKAEREFDD